MQEIVKKRHPKAYQIQTYMPRSCLSGMSNVGVSPTYSSKSSSDGERSYFSGTEVFSDMYEDLLREVEERVANGNYNGHLGTFRRSGLARCYLLAIG